jgi:hypothetical protein
MKSKQLFFENLVTQNALGGIPVGYNFSDKTLYKIFDDLFSGTSFGIISLEANAGLEFNTNTVPELRTIYNTLVADSTPSQIINKLTPKNASVWKTKTIVQVLDEILFPANLPTYIIPTLLLTDTLDPTLEVGTNVTNNLSLVGTKNDAGNFTSLRILKGTTEIESSTPSPGSTATLNYADNFFVPVGITTWTGKASYDQGARKSDSQGVEDTRPYALRSTNAPQLGDNDFTSNSTQIDGIYPFFYGTSTTKLTSTQIKNVIEAGSATKVLTKADGTITITFNASDKYVWFAHADVYTEKTKWYGDALNNGNIGGSTDFINSSNLIEVSSPNGYWTTNYLTYISDYSTNTVGALQFRNS